VRRFECAPLDRLRDRSFTLKSSDKERRKAIDTVLRALSSNNGGAS